MIRFNWRLIPVLIFLILAIFLWRGLSLEPHLLPSVQVGKTVPIFDLPNIDITQPRFISNEIKGQFTLLNVWASWCQACSEEQVFLLKLSREGFPIYGLNYKDNPQKALTWVNTWGNPYKLIGSDPDGKVAMNLGVYGTPETFLLDKDGVIRYRYAGILNERVWNQEFVPIIKSASVS